MMVVTLAFTPSADRLAARPAHRERLAALHASGELLAAGPWDDDSGAMLVFRADRARVDEILMDDPYYRTEGVTVSSVQRWHPVVGPTMPD